MVQKKHVLFGLALPCLVFLMMTQILDVKVKVKWAAHSHKSGFLDGKRKYLFETDGTTLKAQYPYKETCNISFLSTHYMTQYEPQGRLGNNMFKLLMLLGTSIDHCYTPVITNEFAEKLQNVFDLPFISRIHSVPTNWSFFVEFSDTVYTSEVETLDHRKNWTFVGYFQSWRYTRKYEQFIKSKINFKKDIAHAVSHYFKDTSEFRNKTTVCVHVRRTDYADRFHEAHGFSSADVGYFNRSMDYYRNYLKDKGIVFIYISDDIEWCQMYIKGPDIFYSPFDNSSPGRDMALMSQCNHNIISSGTFGWIGAWLGHGHVVYYKGYPRPGSIRDRKTNRYDYYPPEWVGLF